MEINEIDISFSDVEEVLAEIANPIVKSIIRDLIYTFPPDSLKQDLRKLVSNINTRSKKKYKCICKNCNGNSINSHELSKRQMEKTIAQSNIDGKVIVKLLEPNVSDGVPKFISKEKSTKSATIFQGYCKKHDSDFFNELDSLSDPDNYSIIKMQFLRTIAAKISKLRVVKACIEECLQELKKLSEEKINLDTNYTNQAICENLKIEKDLETIESKVKRYDQEIQYFQELHNKFFEEKESIQVKRYGISNVGFMGSIVERSKKENIFVYIAKYKNEFYLYLGYWNLENDLASSFFRDCDFYHENDDQRWCAQKFIVEFILCNKENLIFGNSFDKDMENILCSNNIFCNEYNCIDYFTFAKYIFERKI